MASSFSVTNNHYLRLIYSGNTDIIKKADREDKSNSRLNAADSRALQKGLLALANMDLDSYDKENETQTTKFYNTTKALADAYNYTLESGSASQNSSITKLTDKMKKLSSQYADKFADYGITFDSKGYMNLKESALKNISASHYTDLIGKDSDYNKELQSLAKQMSRHIDVAL